AVSLACLRVLRDGSAILQSAAQSDSASLTAEIPRHFLSGKCRRTKSLERSSAMQASPVSSPPSGWLTPELSNYLSRYRTCSSYHPTTRSSRTEETNNSPSATSHPGAR